MGAGESVNPRMPVEDRRIYRDVIENGREGHDEALEPWDSEHRREEYRVYREMYDREYRQAG